MVKIFLLGSERSGSNLLRTLIGNHSMVSAPIAAHLCDVFFSTFTHYKNIGIDSLLTDIQTYVNHDFNDWKLNIDIQSLKARYKLDFFPGVLNAIYSEKAIQENKQAYFCKDNHNYRYALGIARVFPDAKFIYLHRDPRDQVASWLRNPIHLHTAYKAAAKWQFEQQQCIQLKEFFGLEVYSIKYEDLIIEPELQMTNLLVYLDLPVETACFSTRNENPEAEKHRLWANINKPIMKHNFSKYQDVIEGDNLTMIETVCLREMAYLGYASVTKHNWQIRSSLIFALREYFQEILSRRRNKEFLEKEMRILWDKQDLVKRLFRKFDL